MLCKPSQPSRLKTPFALFLNLSCEFYASADILKAIEMIRCDSSMELASTKHCFYSLAMTVGLLNRSEQ